MYVFLANHNLLKQAQQQQQQQNRPNVQTTKKTPRSGKATGTNRGECVWLRVFEKL